MPDGAGITTRHRVSLMTEDGVQQFVLAEQNAVRFAESALENSVACALEGFATHRVRDRRAIESEARGTGDRVVRVGYVVEAPLWKASYRLTLGGEKATLQGWAHLENLSGHAWNDVDLTLVAGNPVTFRQALYTAYFVARPEVPVEVLGRVLPPAYEGTLAFDAKDALQPPEAETMARAAPMAAPAPGMTEFAGSAVAADAAVDGGGGGPISAPSEIAQGTIATARDEAATQVILHIAEPVTLAPGQSLSVPVIDAAVPAEQIALYNQSVHARHPLAGVHLSNTTGTGLPPGVLTLYERRDSGTIYVGDARLSTLPTGDEHMLSFAVDSSIVVDRDDRLDRSVVSAKISQGTLRLSTKEFDVSRYRIKSSASEMRRLVIEHPRQTGWDLVAGAMVTGLSETAHRLPLELEPGATVETDVTLERTIGESYALADFTPDMLVYYADSACLSPTVQHALKQLSVRRVEIETVRQRITQLDDAKARLFDDQTRLRKNLGQAPAESDLHARYLKKLSTQEDEADKLAVDLAIARDALAVAEASYAEPIRALDL